jgi:hypothetical protein
MNWFARRLRKLGAEVNIGMDESSRYCGVKAIPANKSMIPESISTIGTDRAVYPSEARFGHGLASMRGIVGMSKIPKGQNSQLEGNIPRAYKAMVKSGTGMIWPDLTPK